MIRKHKRLKTKIWEKILQYFSPYKNSLNQLVCRQVQLTLFLNLKVQQIYAKTL